MLQLLSSGSCCLVNMFGSSPSWFTLKKDSLCATPSAYKSSGGCDATSFKLPEGGIIGAPVYYYSKVATNASGYFYRYKVDEVLAHGVIHDIDGITASIGWLRMVHRNKPERGVMSAWQKGDLAEGAMDTFREVALGGPLFQLIPVFRWEPPTQALELLESIQEQKPLPVQVNSFEIVGAEAILSLSLLSGQEFQVRVDAGVPLINVANQILEALGRGPDPVSLISWSLQMITPEGKLMQLHDRVPGSAHAAGNALLAAALSAGPGDQTN